MYKVVDDGATCRTHFASIETTTKIDLELGDNEFSRNQQCRGKFATSDNDVLMR